jgi:hypothetical protein
MTSHTPRLVNLMTAAALIGLAVAGGRAETPSPQQRKADHMSSEMIRSNETGGLTGKERLGRKWSDEQRLDNCNVPVEKRGIRPRPSECLHNPIM